MKLYLDIETTGLSPTNDEITIIGLLCDGHFERFVENIGLYAHLVDEFILRHKPTEVVGYNSNNFDIPFLTSFGVKTLSDLTKVDLMHKCHNLNIKGGLKKAEQILGIERKFEPLNFFQQRALWKKWINNNDWYALDRLLQYNKEDVCNLPILEERLKERQEKQNKKHDIFRKAYLEKLKISEVDS